MHASFCCWARSAPGPNTTAGQSTQTTPLTGLDSTGPSHLPQVDQPTAGQPDQIVVPAEPVPTVQPEPSVNPDKSIVTRTEPVRLEKHRITLTSIKHTLANYIIPTCYTKALQDPLWREAMSTEFNALV